MKKPYTNNTKGIQHIGSVTVMPGQTREIEASHIQAHTGIVDLVKAKKPDENPHVLFLSANVKTIKKTLSSLSDEDLDAIEKLELAAERPRSGVTNAITEERLTRATAAKSEVEKFIASMDGMSDEELLEYVELYKGDDKNIAYLEAINTEIEKRAGNEN